MMPETLISMKAVQMIPVYLNLFVLLAAGLLLGLTMFINTQGK
jgi:hypothetical protein